MERAQATTQTWTGHTVNQPSLSARALAFYLPQYHPVPENDAWWGTGFTEWTNVTRAKKLFPGHRQPHLPSDLGFYDLRVPEAREAQAELAQRYGIAAFVYWHYWFGAGRRILERPFTEVLQSGQPSQPFILAWANQTWSGTWHGEPNRILLQQSYPGPEDDRAHFDAIVDAFRDDRYLTVDGRPIFYVFNPHELPSAAGFVDRWQSMARAAGLPGLYLVAEISDLGGGGAYYFTAAEDGFDAGVYLRLPSHKTPMTIAAMRATRRLMGGPEIYPYAREPLPRPAPFDGPFYQPSLYPNWDNTPRSKRNGLVLTGSSPERFRPHVREAIAHVQSRDPQERLVWIKSWNEWAEGNYLEPDEEFGHGWLQVVRDELTRGRDA